MTEEFCDELQQLFRKHKLAVEGTLKVSHAGIPDPEGNEIGDVYVQWAGLPHQEFRTKCTQNRTFPGTKAG